jgi:DNA-binding beta-propeller fold protein YncE
MRIVTNIPLGISATKVAVDSATNMIYVIGGRTVAVINGSTNTVVTKIHAGVKLADVAVSPAIGMIYVTDAQSPNIFVISGKQTRWPPPSRSAAPELGVSRPTRPPA